MENTNSDFLYFSGGILFLTLCGLTAFSFFLKNKDINNSSGDNGNNNNTSTDVNERARLHFAAVTLTGLGLICTLAMGMYYFSNPQKAGTEIFSIVSQAIVPLVTLVIGFYFGRNQKD